MNRSTNIARHLRVKHIHSVAAIQHGIDAYLKELPTSHRKPLTPPRFDPSRTSNPAVADAWEQRVAALHAKVRITTRAKRKTLASSFDPAPLASYERAGFVLGLTRGVPTYEIVRHPSGGVTVWYHPEGTADQYSVYAHADAHKGFDADKAIPSLKREAFALYSAWGAY
jgi:hypothetical protein